jgi:hypothetical protein
MFDWFGIHVTLAAFRWVDDELSALPSEASFAKWWDSRRTDFKSRLPEKVTHGSFPASLPDHLKSDLSRFILLEEMLYQLTHGSAGGQKAWTGDTLLGTLPPLDGGWGDHQLWASDVLRWFRGWQREMESDLAGMLTDVQLLTGAPDLEVAHGVRLRIDPEYLTQLRAADGASAQPVHVERKEENEWSSLEDEWSSLE